MIRSVVFVLAAGLAAAPATAAWHHDAWLGGGYLTAKAGLLEMRATSSWGGLGADLWIYGMRDASFSYPLDNGHLTVSAVASSLSESFVLSGLVGIGNAVAYSRSDRQTALSPDVGARMLWNFSERMRIRLDGTLSMYADGFTFLGGISYERAFSPSLSWVAGWRLSWVTAEQEQDVVKNGILVGLAFGTARAAAP